jgi:hypothetical protein
MSTVLKRTFCIGSFAMALVSVACLLLPNGTLSFPHLTRVWVAAAAVGIVCAILGGGLPGKQPASATGFWALALNGALLLLLGFLHVVAAAHLD